MKKKEQKSKKSKKRIKEKESIAYTSKKIPTFEDAPKEVTEEVDGDGDPEETSDEMEGHSISHDDE